MRPAGFEVAPWHLSWRGTDPDAMAAIESIFALSNGHIGMRANLEEGEPVFNPGTYLNGFYEQRELPYAEGGYGYPEDGQTVVNVTNGKIIRLLVEDEPMDMRYGNADEHEWKLDFRAGTLERVTDWTSPTGRKVRVRSTRLVSFTERAIAAIRYEVEPLDLEMEIVVQSDLLANEDVPRPGNDPRLAAALDRPLVGDFAEAKGHRGVLGHHTKESGLRMAAGMDHELLGTNSVNCEILSDDLARLTVTAKVQAGQKFTVIKYLSYGWSSQRSPSALRAQVDAALATALDNGWDELLSRQRKYLDDFWRSADVTLDGDAELQQAVRFALFHVLQAGARGETRAIPGKGLTGPGYDGHAFWDTETYVLPVLTYTVPAAAADALRWRHSTLDKAKARAVELGQVGAMFPWRSINGEECSSYWPAGSAAVHVNADIAYAVSQYIAATGDEQFEVTQGVELLVETARSWASLGHHDLRGDFRIDGVTGPDEYSAVANNNVFTNLMAQKNFRDAADACKRHPTIARHHGVDDEEMAYWRDCADRMLVVFDPALGVHQQSESFTRQALWDFDSTPKENYPLLLHYPYQDLYRKQVVKQADLVLAMYLRGDAFTPEQKLKNFDYYDPITVRDSSLSACAQSIVAAEVGYLDLAYDYFAEAALTDLHDLHHNASSGLHIASLAGTWLCCVAGFGGMRDHNGSITFAPRLPARLHGLTFRLSVRDRCIAVRVRPGEATYQLVYGEPMEAQHHGQTFTVHSGETVLEIPALHHREPPTQPRHCEPYQREARL
ncbi:alpha,alpha-trehalose phosphorylase [Williamsia limnetica]|uniref:Alpha,alpha-trehalose phosphorylase n=1 Tax=Williamsia limnetica TaxID=882452 RepID=A0A318RVA1_WILLI|nr:glycosyl hydrolase family 65 protein [Williamsia limnetica]PYE20240.1 alpha,alpha-trehalose phosphorylase [Williamsia limnetica]